MEILVNSTHVSPTQKGKKVPSYLVNNLTGQRILDVRQFSLRTLKACIYFAVLNILLTVSLLALTTLPKNAALSLQICTSNDKKDFLHASFWLSKSQTLLFLPYPCASLPKATEEVHIMIHLTLTLQVTMPVRGPSGQWSIPDIFFKQ
jgi:hypothetical protein